MKAYQIKTEVPHLGAIVNRERLFRRIDELDDYPVTWVASPAGSGKTTLVASYVRTRGMPVLWYRVDQTDHDVASFFYHMREAAQKLKGCAKPLPFFTPKYRLGMTVFTHNYFESLYGRMISPGAIVFDNYQDVAEDSEIHEVIRNGLKVVPEGLRVFIVSRKTFPPPFVSLQAESMLALLSWDDIQFTVDEVRELMSQRSNIATPEALAVRIHEETKGWAAAIVILMAGQREVSSLGVEPVGHSAVFNYFAVEVFDKFDSRTQCLLLGTALLPSISPESGCQLTGVEESAQILADLNSNHCFVTRYGSEYHYHPLFREFLLSIVEKSSSPEEIRMAQSSAGAFLLKSGQTEAAVNLLAASGSWGSLIPAILDKAPTLVAEGRDKTLERWIQRIPEEIYSQIPWLLYWLAVCSQHYEPPASYALFVRSFNLFEERNDTKGALLAWSGAVHSIMFNGRDMKLYDTWIDWLDNYILRCQPFPSSEIESNVASGITAALLARRPDRPDLRIWLDKARTLSNPLFAVAHMFLGDYGHWAMVTRESEKSAKSGDLFYTICWYYNKASLVNETRPPHESALSIVEEGLKLSAESGVLHWVPRLLTTGFYAAIIAGQHQRGLEFLKQLESMLGDPPSITHIRYHSACALYYVLVGNVARAITHGKEARRIAAETGFIPIEAFTYIFSAFIFLEAGRFSEARNCIAACRALPVASCMIIEYSRLIAEAALALHEGMPQVPDILRKAFALGRREGYMAPCSWWQPALMVRLCKEALAKGIEVEHVQHIIRSHNLIPDEALVNVDGWPWPLKIATLGIFEVLVNNEPLHFTGKVQKRPLALLKALIALGGKEVSENMIEDMLWPEAEGDMAHIVFKTTLSRLRRLLKIDGAIEVRGGKVSLNGRFVRVDTWDLECLAERVTQAWADRRERRVIDAMQQTISLLGKIYRGNFLNTDDDTWIAPSRDRFRSTYLGIVKKLGAILDDTDENEKLASLYDCAINAGLSPEEIRGRPLHFAGPAK